MSNNSLVCAITDRHTKAQNAPNQARYGPSRGRNGLLLLWYSFAHMDTSPQVPPSHPKFVRWALMLGIVIVLNIFFVVLVQLALPAPKMEVYCPAATLRAPDPMTATTCDAAGGVWNDYGVVPAQPTVKGETPAATGYCDMYAKCQPVYQAALDHHDLYAFGFMLALGVIALIIGILPIGSAIVSTGLSYGGVLALVIGSAQYWGSAGQWIKLLIAAIGLAALLYIGVKRFKD